MELGGLGYLTLVTLALFYTAATARRAGRRILCHACIRTCIIAWWHGATARYQPAITLHCASSTGQSILSHRMLLLLLLRFCWPTTCARARFALYNLSTTVQPQCSTGMHWPIVGKILSLPLISELCIMIIVVFVIARQHTDARYRYSNSVLLSVTFRY